MDKLCPVQGLQLWQGAGSGPLVPSSGPPYPPPGPLEGASEGGDFPGARPQAESPFPGQTGVQSL